MIRLLQRFRSSRDGNFAMMLGILALPLALFVGLAVDYGTLSRTRAKLQNATDSAVLAVAREGANLSQTESEQIANRMLKAAMNSVETPFRLVRQNSSITLTAKTKAPTVFDRLFGVSEQMVSVLSQSQVATMNYEIGLVIDTTGSMKGGKLVAMKDAVNGLIDSMSAQVLEDDKLKFALIPFSTFVNVGPDFGPTFDNSGRQVPGSGRSWLDLQGIGTIDQSELGTGASRFQLYQNMKLGWYGCVETRPSASNLDVSDAPAANAASVFVPAFAPDEPDSGFANNYIRSNALPYDMSIAQIKKRWAKYGVATDANGHPLNGGLLSGVLNLVGSLLGSLLGGNGVVPDFNADFGPNTGCSSRPITPLTASTDKIKDEVAALQAKGNTNITEGVAWGMRVLSPNEPFTEGASASNPSVRKIMIVLTDGTNTLGERGNVYGSVYSAYGYLNDGRLPGAGSSGGSIKSAMNDRTLAACDVAKAAKIEIYTIRLEEPDVATGTMLRDCASSPSNYFDVPNRSQLDEAFEEIKDLVTVVRLSS